MARTTDALVKAVLLDSYDKRRKPDLAPFIRAANLLTSRLESAAVDYDPPLLTDELAEIETWLAAHAYCAPDQPYAQRTTSSAQGSFQGKTGMYLEGTKFGQMAVILDHTGLLASLASGESIEQSSDAGIPGGFWLGKPPSEQIHYLDRD